MKNTLTILSVLIITASTTFAQEKKANTAANPTPVKPGATIITSRSNIKHNVAADKTTSVTPGNQKAIINTSRSNIKHTGTAK